MLQNARINSEEQNTYDLSLDWINYLVNASPLVWILGLSPYHAETFQNVDDIVDSSPFYAQFSRALIEQKEVLLLFAINAQKSSTQFAQTLFLAVVFWVIGVIWLVDNWCKRWVLLEVLRSINSRLWITSWLSGHLYIDSINRIWKSRIKLSVCQNFILLGLLDFGISVQTSWT